MTIAQRARIVSGVLDARLPEPQIPLQHRDPFTLLVSVILSAQCTDERVNKVTPALFRRASTPEAMAALSPETVREYISSCGLSERKARNIVETSRILVEQYDGCVPNRFEELEALPGVGHKTASVVMNQAFGFPAFPVDTHIFRLARRWKLSKGKNVEKVEIDLKKIFPKDEWGKRHLQIVLYGRQFCPARGCGDLCPICSALFSGNR
ncbi:MAG: endonuclease III [Akkermansia sp.]|nr:endonuclease III [Akkermansia sp.]